MEYNTIFRQQLKDTSIYCKVGHVDLYKSIKSTIYIDTACNLIPVNQILNTEGQKDTQGGGGRQSRGDGQMTDMRLVRMAERHR